MEGYPGRPQLYVACGDCTYHCRMKVYPADSPPLVVGTVVQVAWCPLFSVALQGDFAFGVLRNWRCRCHLLECVVAAGRDFLSHLGQAPLNHGQLVTVSLAPFLSCTPILTTNDTLRHIFGAQQFLVATLA